MLRRLTLCAALALAAPAAAQQPASMSADQAYVRAVTYTQAQYSRQSGDTAELKALLNVALAKLKDLETRAKAQDAVARSTLNDFAQGNTAKGVDSLLVQATANASAAQPKAAAEDYKAAGALAFASDTNRAVTAYEAALKLAPEDGGAAGQLAALYLRLGRLDDVVRLAGQLIASTDPLMQSYGYMRRGAVAHMRGELALAESSYSAGLAVATIAGMKDRQAAALGNLGAIAQTRGDLAGAEDYQKRSLALHTELGRKEGQAANLGNLGAIAQTRGDLAAAEDYQKRALALNTELGSKEGQASALGRLGNIAGIRGDLASAEAYLTRALALNTELGSKQGQASALGSLGGIARLRGDLAGAEDYQKRALALNTELGSKEGQATVLAGLGWTAFARKDSKQGCTYLTQALNLYEGMGAGQSANAKMTRDKFASQQCPR